MLERAAYLVCSLVLAASLILLVLGSVRSPVAAERARFESELAAIQAPELDLEMEDAGAFEIWQRAIASNPRLWQPLTTAPARMLPPPDLAQVLAGVEPTRNTMGTGPTQKVQIRVDGARGWYTRGDQIKGCTIEEITDAHVVFSAVHNGQKYGIPLPRR